MTWWTWLVVGFITGWGTSAVMFLLMVNRKSAVKRPVVLPDPGRESHQAVTPVVPDRPGG